MGIKNQKIKSRLPPLESKLCYRRRFAAGDRLKNGRPSAVRVAPFPAVPLQNHRTVRSARHHQTVSNMMKLTTKTASLVQFAQQYPKTLENIDRKSIIRSMCTSRHIFFRLKI